MIAYVVQRFPAATETFTYDEVRALRDGGLDLVVYSFRPGDELGWPLQELDVRLLPPSLGAMLGWLRRRPLRMLRAAAWVAFGRFERPVAFRRRVASLAALPRGAALASQPGITLFHAQFANEAATAAMIAAYLSGGRFSFRSHTARAPQLLRQKLRRAELVLSISDDDRSRLLAVEPGARVEVARLGVPVREPAPARRPGLVAAVGSLTEKKGHHVLAEAVRSLVSEGVEVECEIAGEGPWRPRIHGEGVVLRGRLDREDVLDLLARASVFVMASVPSEGEGEDGLPVALLEALSLATPAIGSTVSAIPELIRDGETGLLVPPGDSAALAAAIRKLLLDPELARQLGAAGRAVVERDYDPARCYARAAELLGKAAR